MGKLILYPIHTYLALRLKNRMQLVLLLLIFFFAATAIHAQGLEKRRDASSRHQQQNSGLKSIKGNVFFEIKGVDITHFPQLSVIFSAVNDRNVFVQNLKKEDVIVLENGIQRPIISLDLISAQNRVPVDIIFVIDQTASMKDLISTVKDNVRHFVEQIRTHGFDFRLGMVRFSDTIEWVSPTLTEDITEFEKWVADIQTVGGGDDKENALEGLHVATAMKMRPNSLHLLLAITDAQYHQKGEPGDGTTEFTTKSMGDYLYEREVRLITISKPEYPEYQQMASATEGVSFDIDKPFDTVLAQITQNITSLYALKYLSQSTLAPDSVRIDILRSDDQSPLASRKLQALEEGKRFVFEDLLFQPNQAALAQEFIEELERVVRLLFVRPTMRLRIEGHADLTGPHDKNMELSLKRAEAVKQYLVSSGIQPSRLEIAGYGDTRPIADNATEEGRRLNRRIEFVILSK
ncbi:MAG TPA: OmpA family protein [Candidatus Kapabacteria bacterium]|nr:OmpA family protein [Candidatus Kapabacteria bacterium]